jgi:hypothetical protein
MLVNRGMPLAIRHALIAVGPDRWNPRQLWGCRSGALSAHMPPQVMTADFLRQNPGYRIKGLSCVEPRRLQAYLGDRKRNGFRTLNLAAALHLGG